MARTTLPKTTLVGPYPTLPVAANSLDLTMTAADVVNDNQFLASSDTLLIVRNSAVGAQTFTLTSVADDKNRTGDVSAYSLGPGEMAVFRFRSPGWRQADGYIYLEASDAGILFGVIDLT